MRISTTMTVNIGSWILGTICIAFLLYSYLSVEIATAVHSGEFAFDSLCSDYEGFKYGKVVSYKGYKNAATVYCIYEEPKKQSRN